MKRVFRIFPILILCILFVSVALAGCIDTSDDDDYYIALTDGTAAEYFDKDSGYYVFEAGKVDWQAFSFGLYAADGTLEDEITLETGMISSDDLAKVNYGGVYLITIHYQGLSANIPLKILNPTVSVYYSVTYHAGAGAEFPDADPQEVVSGDDGPEWTISYENGKIDVTPIAEKPGYSFKGWRTENGATVASGITINSDRHYYAAWTDDISFNVQVSRYLDGSFVTVMDAYSGSVERNKQFMLPDPSPTASYSFESYTVIAGGTEVTVTEPGASVTITADTEIRVNYVTNKFTVRFIVNAADSKVGTVTHPWSEEGAEVTMGNYPDPIPIQFVENVVSYGGNSIDGYCLILQLPYGTQLGTDTVYVPPVPNVDGATGSWKGTNGLNAVFGTVTSELNYVASYTLISYTATFMTPPAGYLTPGEALQAGKDLENVKENNGNNLVFGNLHYGETVLARSGAFPGVPSRTGYVGEWLFLARDGSWQSVYEDAENGVLNTELNNIIKDHIISASYNASDYTVTLHDTDSSIIYQQDLAFNSVFAIPEDTLAELYAEYPSELYVLHWRNGYSGGPEVSLPIQVTRNIDLYLSLTRQPYTVEFRGQGAVQFDPVVKEVTPNLTTGVAELELPEISVPGYVVIGWRYNDFTGESISDYVPGQSYPRGSKVRFNNVIYIADSDASGTQTPGIAVAVWSTYTGYRKTIEQSNGKITVTSSHTYSQNILYDTAFYVITEPISYTVNISAVDYLTPGADASVTSFKQISVNYNSAIISSTTTGAQNLLLNPESPKYLDGSEGNFVFDGWYLDRTYTVPVDISTYVLNENTVPVGGLYLYPRWTDINLGTPGLIFEAIAGTSDYAVVGFDSTGYEEFSSIVMYIPDFHNGGNVTTIRSGAFKNVSKILTFTELHIEANLTTIEDNALTGLIGLKNIVVSETSSNFKYGDNMLTDASGSILYLYTGTSAQVDVSAGVTRIAGGAFAGNAYVQRVAFAAGSTLTEIGDSAFFGAVYLSEIALPASLVTIGENAFKGTLSLRSVTVDAGSQLKTVRKGAFDDCLAALGDPDDNGFIVLGGVLIKYTGSASVTELPASVTAIAAGAFDSVEGAAVTRLTVAADSGLEFVAKGAFDGAISLSQIYLLTPNVPTAETGAFDGMPVGAVLSVDASTYLQFTEDEVYAAAFGDGIEVYD